MKYASDLGHFILSRLGVRGGAGGPGGPACDEGL